MSTKGKHNYNVLQQHFMAIIQHHKAPHRTESSCKMASHVLKNLILSISVARCVVPTKITKVCDSVLCLCTDCCHSVLRFSYHQYSVCWMCWLKFGAQMDFKDKMFGFWCSQDEKSQSSKQI